MLSTLATALLAAQLTASPAPTPAAPSPTAPASNAQPAAAPLGGDLFPVPAPPAASCLANAPALGSSTMPAGVIDGRTLKTTRDLARLRRTATGVMFVSGADFSGQRFSKRKLQDICFVNAKLGLTDWSNFGGTGIGFIDSDLTGAKFTGAKLPWSLLRDSTLAQVDATGADFSRSRLDGGWKGSMRGLKLDRATLTGFRVECGLTSVDGCPLDRQDMSLKGADLTKASFWPFYFPDVDASGAVLDQTEVGLEHLGRFKGAKVAGPLIVRSRRNAAIFLPAELARMQRAFLSGAAAGGASFNCAAARTPVQRAICTAPSSELRRLDRAVALLEVGAPPPGAAAPTTRRAAGLAARLAAAAIVARAAWIAERDACGTREEDEIAPCLLNAYHARRDALARAAGAPGWVKPDSLALFISSDAPLTPEFIRSELFQRISPVVLDSAQARMLLRVDAAGRIEAKGAALGDCRLRATGLAYNPATLALGAGGSPAVMSAPVRSRRGRRRIIEPAMVLQPAVPAVPVLQAAGDELRVIATGAPYAQCGPNGSFVPMTRVDLPQATLANLWAES